MNRIDIDSSEYPDSLKRINNPPPVLYYRGRWNPEIFRDTLGIVGSRKMTRYGRWAADRFVSATVASGINIVSGFMYGIDAAAHSAAVENNGRTVAVMPCGIDRIHPGYQKDLYYKIIEKNGLIVSEYPGEFPPALWTYPKRNRIIAGLSEALLVIEAGLKSGALITASICEDYGIRIFAVPGPLSSEVSLGTAELVKRGADIVTGPEDILHFYGKQKEADSSGDISPLPGISKTSLHILELLGSEPMNTDEISGSLGISVADASAELSLLSLKNMISRTGDRYHLLKGL